MDDHEFTVGGTYRNRRGVYEVVALKGDKMTIRYEDGSQQTVGVALQARIWANIQADESPHPNRKRPAHEDEGLDTQPIADLVRRVLATKSASHPPDIIDQVCLAIEQNPDWHNEYDSLVENFSSQGKDGRLTVNSFIGWYVCDQTGMVSIKAGNTAKSTLIQSYSSLTYPQSGETLLWQQLRKLKGRTLTTLDQKRPFDVSEITSDRLYVRPHISDKERPVTRETFEGAWRELTFRGELSLMDVKDRYSDWSPVYVTAVLAEMPGVSYRIRPVILLYEKNNIGYGRE